MVAASRPLYNFLFRRNYVFLGVVFASAFAFEVYVLDPWEEPKENCRWLIRYSTYDITADRIWDNINKGRQWKDIRAKYVQSQDGDDE
ncbi:hypothetical protein OIDMADRAFT_156855 [Oidiodendron maius Zn]|uniref:Complex III subunit 9 n=1 Tax=Oidiodendron maius (strain Zn) TaxID=913774 RepID=A0A0C3D0B6_OIDMZ|nr:hypothetical protein OIDMADRAFT_156855 [Oidiodendron maius Zn]